MSHKFNTPLVTMKRGKLVVNICCLRCKKSIDEKIETTLVDTAVAKAKGKFPEKCKGGKQ